MRIMTLSGWGQPYDALMEAFPDSTPIGYAHYPSMQQAMEEIAVAAKSHDVVVGWSLGGRLAAQATLAGLMRPKKLVLIASAFQFAKSAELPMGISQDQHDKFRDNYRRNSRRAIDKGWELIIKDDKYAERIRARFTDAAKQSVLNGIDWLRWLDDLNGFTFHGKNLEDIPPTLLIHGTNDAIVYPEQSQHFASLLPQAKLVMLEDCGHAPHWHNPEFVRDTVREFIRV
ncbi:MAG: alpha/beta fold hydrolase [Alphaproteobacteria bacterium]